MKRLSREETVERMLKLNDAIGECIEQFGAGSENALTTEQIAGMLRIVAEALETAEEIEREGF